MRLIDADKIPTPERALADDYDYAKGCPYMLTERMVESFVENCSVEAIPVSFIEDYLTNVVAKNKYEHLRTHKWLGIKQLISAWRKENVDSESA